MPKLSRSASEPGPPSSRPTIPRAWLVGLIATIVLPWLVMATLYTWRETPPSSEAPAAPAATLASAGPWGALIVAPIVISPPLEYVSGGWGPPEPATWNFPKITAGDLERFLRSTGIPADAAARLMAVARPAPQLGGFTINPDPDLLRGLDPEVRARLYFVLATIPQNFDQAAPYRFWGSAIEEWLPQGLVSPATRALVAPLVYKRDGFEFFADIDLVRSLVNDREEFHRLVKGLYRQATVLVSVEIDRPSRVKEVAEYWGRGGRRTDIRPLLESAASSGPRPAVDISHLLPALAREHLYRYPRLTDADLNRPALAWSLWTALNFFSDQPDARLLDLNTALDHLRRDYYIVEDEFQLGDVIAFLDGNGNLIHAGVYLAGDLVFGKHGPSRLTPWTILPLDAVKGHYRPHTEGWQVIYHRRKDL